MGGYGSGWHRARTHTVEDGWILSAAALMRDNILRPNHSFNGAITWSDSRTGEKLSNIGLSSETYADYGSVRLHYTITDTGDALDYRVDLTATPLPWGGVKWWFLCPLIVDGTHCGRRVAKLYHPPGGRYYGCRHCHKLTYTSSRKAHQYESCFGRLGREFGLSGREVAKLRRR
jgi:hypothetical protein